MKKSYLLIAILFLSAFLAYAEEPGYKCVTMEELEKQKKENPYLEAQMQQFEEQTQMWIKEHYKKSGKNQMQAGLGGEITIPVVVHVLWNTADQYVSPEEVGEQILIMCNRDFAGENVNSMWSFSPGLKVNTGIKFCLANKAPDGSPTTGIEERQTYLAEFPLNNYMKYTDYGGLDAWDPKVYFNVWVCNTPGSNCWAQFPGTGLNSTYGIVVDYIVFGPGGYSPGFNKGSITTHEIGHCLNLRHIWGDDEGACTGTDYCEDVPNQANYQSGCPTGIVYDACTNTDPGIMYMNFMDYTNNDAAANFTPDQNARMWACFAAGAPLEPLLSSSACNYLEGECNIPSKLTATSIMKASAVLGWLNMVNAVSYNIQYRKYGTTTWTYTTSGTNSKSITGLTRGTTYEFQVQSVCSGGTSEYSSSYAFKTPRTDPPTYLAQPVLTTPANNSTGINISPVLSWQPVSGAIQYILHYSITSDFTTAGQVVTTSTSTSLSNLAFTTKYYWKVLAKYYDLVSSWSEVSNFTTAGITIEPPELWSPGNNSQGVALNPTLTWHPAGGADSYNLQYSTSSTFDTYIPINDITGTSASISGLSKRTTYYWRVNAVYDGVVSDWSSPWKFKTTSSGKFGIGEEEIGTQSATLAFSPNPLTNTAHFTLEVFTPEVINIYIVDIFGKSVANLMNEQKTAGTYAFDFDASDLLPGVYYCHLMVGNEITTMKLVIVR